MCGKVSLHCFSHSRVGSGLLGTFFGLEQLVEFGQGQLASLLIKCQHRFRGHSALRDYLVNASNEKGELRPLAVDLEMRLMTCANGGDQTIDTHVAFLMRPP
jgi:hypothetical protein